MSETIKKHSSRHHKKNISCNLKKFYVHIQSDLVLHLTKLINYNCNRVPSTEIYLLISFPILSHDPWLTFIRSFWQFTDNHTIVRIIWITQTYTSESWLLRTF